MRHSLSFIVALGLLQLSALPAAQAFDRDKLLPSFNSIVMIRGYNPDGSMAYGSGVVVHEDKVLTNCHIFRQTTKPWASRGEESYSIVSIQADRYHDLCLVTTDNLPLRPIPLGDSAHMKKGQEVIAIGHSSGVPAPLISAGTLKSLYAFEHGNVIRTSARFAMGASGSGLFDAEGRLVGINTFKSPGRSAYFYALPIEWLAQLEQQPVETRFPIDGKTFWEEDDERKPFFMQMAIPELRQDWVKLEDVARRWVLAEADSTEAWYELGHAQESLGQLAQAEESYKKSLSIDPANSDSLFRLGMIASARGDLQRVAAVRTQLGGMDADIASEFDQAILAAKPVPN